MPFGSCEYCDRTYHPMRVYTPEGKPEQGQKMKIRVCSNENCREQAEEDGYEYREDLTPTR